MTGDSWTHKLANPLVRRLIGTGVTPNHLTTLRLITGLIACGLFDVTNGEVTCQNLFKKRFLSSRIFDGQKRFGVASSNFPLF